jgi:hypothetical protein
VKQCNLHGRGCLNRTRRRICRGASLMKHLPRLARRSIWHAHA